MPDKPFKSVFEVLSLTAIGLAVLCVALVIYEMNRTLADMDEINRRLVKLEESQIPYYEEEEDAYDPMIKQEILSNLPIPIAEPDTQTIISLPLTSPDSRIQPMKLYLARQIEEGDANYNTDCNYELVPVRVDMEPETMQVGAVLELLLESKDPTFRDTGLYNSLYKSDLASGGVGFSSGTIMAGYEGDLIFDNACEADLIESQMKAILLQDEYVENVQITINGKKLEDILAGEESGLFLDD